MAILFKEKYFAECKKNIKDLILKISYADQHQGIISKLEYKQGTVKFGQGLGPSFYVKNMGQSTKINIQGQNGQFEGDLEGIYYSLSYVFIDNTFQIKAIVENRSNKVFEPEALGLKLGIDTYMQSYPQWNDIFFPTLLRCEKTHLWGYFLTPTQRALAITSDLPIAAWELDYNKLDIDENGNSDCGHRIITANLLLLCKGPLPSRHPQHLISLNHGETITRTINLAHLDNFSEIDSVLINRFGIPRIDFERYTIAKGEVANLDIKCQEDYNINIISPDGSIISEPSFVATQYGIYTATVTATSGRMAESKLYCRHEYGWYLKAARENAINKPQKASTHTESWYGHYSSFLAKKHYPNKVLDVAAQENFDEIMPLMYNFKRGKANVIPRRVQNIASLLGLLVDLYESSPSENIKYLDYANNMARELIARQTKDGAYRNHKEHYTSVIYIAKSMLELAICERKLSSSFNEYKKRSSIHFLSAKAAVDDLKLLRETIGTEGEYTLEDGMITCSALQLAFFALNIDESQRKQYIDAAEHLMAIHLCLEQSKIPDCRMRGATLRFWEAQYDVQIKANMITAPHGWTSWKNYATYYLYLLTGKEQYLIYTIDTLGACLQQIDESKKLRWAFVVDPYLNVDVFVPDLDKKSDDGYESANVLTTSSHKGKYDKQVIGEDYVDMISDWFRVGKNAKMTGGYTTCPLINAEDNHEFVDTQGSSCDNDAHEHFKCLEETLLKKAFVIVRPNRTLGEYNCSAEFKNGIVKVDLTEECDYLHINTADNVVVIITGQRYNINKGMNFINLNNGKITKAIDCLQSDSLDDGVFASQDIV